MEAWIKVYHDLSDHPKTYALAEKLKVEQFAAVGLVVCLWTWAIIHAPDGDLSRFPDNAIARACHWHKPAAGLVKALQECGFVDGRQIHDWDEYASALMDAVEIQKEKTRKRVEAFRERKRVSDALQEDRSNVTSNADVTLPVTLHGVTSNADVTPCNALRTRTRTREDIQQQQERAREDNGRNTEIGDLVSANLSCMTGKAWEDLRAFLSEMPEDLVKWAILDSCDHGGNNWAYVRRVLGALQDAGIRTVEEAEKRSEAYRQQRQRSRAPIAQLNYEQREYEERKPGELPAWLKDEIELEGHAG